MTVPNVTKKKEGKKEVNWPRGCYSFSSSFFSFSLTKTKLTETLLKFFSSGKPGGNLLLLIIKFTFLTDKLVIS